MMAGWRRVAVGGFVATALGLGPGGIGWAAAPDAACNGDAACAEKLEGAREVARTLASRLQQALQTTLGSGDVPGAIAACNQMAPDYTQQVSTERGWRVTRVSLQPRNPLLGTPDAWEQRFLQQFDEAAATGVDPTTLEVAEIVEEPQGKRLRYLKALPVQAPCLTCHGPATTLSPEVVSALRARYPHDRAVGYGLGDVRGALSVKMPIE
jgi:hypothetical protein